MTEMNGIKAKELNQINTQDGEALCATSAPDWFIAQKGRLGEAFAPPRPGNDIRFFTTGSDYFKDVAQAIKSAKKSVFITGWQINYEVRLDGDTRLWDCLHEATRKENAPDIYLMPWLSPKAGVDTGDMETMLAAFNLNAGLAQRKVWCMPAIQQSDMGNLGTFFSHHQKAVVIDNEIAYVGGIDLAYGRRDDNNFRLAAGDRQARELYNPCIPPLAEIEGHKQYPYMTSVELIGAALMAGDSLSKAQRAIGWASDNRMFNAVRGTGKELGEWVSDQGKDLLRFFGAGAADTTGGVIEIAKFVNNQLTPANIALWKSTLKQWQHSLNAALQELDKETDTFAGTSQGLNDLRLQAREINGLISSWLVSAEQAGALTSEQQQSLTSRAETILAKVENWITQALELTPTARTQSATLKGRIASLKDQVDEWKARVTPELNALESELSRWAKQTIASGQAISNDLLTRGTELVNLWTQQSGLGAFYAWLNNTPTPIITANALKEFDELATPFLLYLHSILDRMADSQKSEPYSYLADRNTRLLPVSGMTIDPKKQPRMPWHDVHMRLEGTSVYDISRNFVARWNSIQARYDGKQQQLPAVLASALSLVSDDLKPVPFIPHFLPEPAPVAAKGSVTAQVLRSAPFRLLQEEHQGKGGQGAAPQSRQANCQQAMLQAISGAQHFIYIENQFFQSDFGESSPSSEQAPGAVTGPMDSLMSVGGLPGYEQYAQRLRLDELEENPANLHKINYFELAKMIRSGETEPFTRGLIQVLSNQSAMEALRAIQEPQATILNDLAGAIAERIERAIDMGESFHVYMVLPAHPEGPLNMLTLMTQVHLTMQTLSLGENSLVDRIQWAMAIKGFMDRGMTEQGAKKQALLESSDEVPVYKQQNWQQYLTLLNLRTWDMFSGYPVTEQIYVHSKLLIADDRVAVIGSANINDRSQLGDRDSELAVVVSGGTTTTESIDGHCNYPVCNTVQQLRMGLWRKLFGLEISHPGVKVKPASQLETTLTQPAAPSSWEAIQVQARDNAKKYEDSFMYVPRNGASIWPTWEEMVDARTTLSLSEKELDIHMPFEKGFWEYPKPADTPGDIRGFITALPVSWTQNEYNDSTANLSILALIEPQFFSGQDASTFAYNGQAPKGGGTT
ncbi:phospholipase D-like domain-containing protein [Halopseudomonas sabulinigri]|uniref:PLD phosphodiesterase domain-containing protein n=1 Tax=Halopseudomonas sabulinigri TaxID=472181 RepID=A0ABP9ZQ78_9GAMM